MAGVAFPFVSVKASVLASQPPTKWRSSSEAAPVGRRRPLSAGKLHRKRLFPGNRRSLRKFLELFLQGRFVAQAGMNQDAVRKRERLPRLKRQRFGEQQRRAEVRQDRVVREVPVHGVTGLDG